MYMNVDAVMSSIADRMGVSKAELLDPTSSDAAVKQALAETHVIQETKKYLKDCGVDLEAFNKKQKDDKILLLKNFPYGTSKDELTKMLTEYGELGRLLMPPAGTIAIAEFVQAPAARSAFVGLAYRRFKDSILFIEKGSKDLFIPGFISHQHSEISSTPSLPAGTIIPKVSAQQLLQPITGSSDADLESIDTTTLYVRNLNFSTTSADLTRVFSPIAGFAKAVVRTKPDPKHPGGTLSMGFGFVDFKTKETAAAALAAMNGFTLDGHQLLVQLSHRGADAAAERRNSDAKKRDANKGSKIIIKNLPFETSKKDISRLFGQYGQLRSVRMPKKFGGPSRGFAFAEFITPKEAATAMDALRDTHLLGRKLVLEYASHDAADAEEEIARMTKKVEKQSHMVAMQNLRDSSKRRKFEMDTQEEAQ